MGNNIMSLSNIKVSRILCFSTIIYFSVIAGFVALNFRNTNFWPFSEEATEMGKVDQISSIINQLGGQIFGELSEDSKGLVKSMVSQGVEATKDWNWEKLQNTGSQYLPSEDDFKATEDESDGKTEQADPILQELVESEISKDTTSNDNDNTLET